MDIYLYILLRDYFLISFIFLIILSYFRDFLGSKVQLNTTQYSRLKSRESPHPLSLIFKTLVHTNANTDGFRSIGPPRIS